jgi:acetoin utilization protein AcuC
LHSKVALLLILNAFDWRDVGIATDDELMLIHKYDYVEAIKHASHGIISEDEAKKYGLNEVKAPPTIVALWRCICLNWPFSSSFNPYFLASSSLIMPCEDRHSATIVGGALTLADLIMSGKVLNGCHLGGGLHHAQPGR